MNIFMWLSIALAITVSYLNDKCRKLKNRIEYKDGELKLLKHNYDTVSYKYYDMVNSDKCKKCTGR